jgi:hypothetical protein
VLAQIILFICPIEGNSSRTLCESSYSFTRLGIGLQGDRSMCESSNLKHKKVCSRPLEGNILSTSLYQHLHIPSRSPPSTTPVEHTSREPSPKPLLFEDLYHFQSTHVKEYGFITMCNFTDLLFQCLQMTKRRDIECHFYRRESLSLNPQQRLIYIVRR